MTKKAYLELRDKDSVVKLLASIAYPNRWIKKIRILLLYYCIPKMAPFAYFCEMTFQSFVFQFQSFILFDFLSHSWNVSCKCNNIWTQNIYKWPTSFCIWSLNLYRINYTFSHSVNLWGMIRILDFWSRQMVIFNQFTIFSIKFNSFTFFNFTSWWIINIMLWTAVYFSKNESWKPRP